MLYQSLIIFLKKEDYRMQIVTKAKIISIKEYSDDLREYLIAPEKYKRYDAGTFLQLTLDDVTASDYWPESRTFSVASSYNNKDKQIKLIIRKVGAYTTRIFNELAIGDSCMVKYAFGDFLLPFYDIKSSICCIAGGTGIAPILSFAEELKKIQQEKRLHVYYSFKNSEENMGINILKEIVPENQLHLYSTREKISGVNCRRIEKNDILNSGLDFSLSHFYICGSENFTNYFKGVLLEEEASNIYTDEW